MSKELVSAKSSVYRQDISLTQLIRLLTELKEVALFPNEDHSRDKLYNKINHLEALLYELTDVNIELKRDWWEQ